MKAAVAKEPTPWCEIILLLATIAFYSLLLCGCNTPNKTSYVNGVILWTSSTALGIGYGEHIEVAPGGKLKRTIKGEKDTLTLTIDNAEVKPEEVGAEKDAVPK